MKEGDENVILNLKRLIQTSSFFKYCLWLTSLNPGSNETMETGFLLTKLIFISLTENVLLSWMKGKVLGVQIASLSIHYCIYDPNDDNYREKFFQRSNL